MPSAGGTTSPGAVPTGGSTVAPAGTCACLRTAAAVASGSTSPAAAAAEPLDDAADVLLELGVERRLASLEPADHLGGEVVRGRAEPAAGDDEIDAELAQRTPGRR